MATSLQIFDRRLVGQRGLAQILDGGRSAAPGDRLQACPRGLDARAGLLVGGFGLLVVEAQQLLSGRHRIALLEEHLIDAAGDLGGQLTARARLDLAGSHEGFDNVPLGDGSDRDRSWQDEKVDDRRADDHDGAENRYDDLLVHRPLSNES